jgi:hypothetical protein
LWPDWRIFCLQWSAGVALKSTILANKIILATGTFSSWYFELLDRKKDFIEAALPWAYDRASKSLIDSIQYSCDYRWLYLPPAPYSIEQVGGGEECILCMCPVAWLHCATSLAKWFNGWSPSKGSGYCNSGIVINCNAGRF